MKNLLTIIVVALTLTVNAQNTTNQFAVLSPGFNYANNSIAANYAANKTLPAGYSISTAKQIANNAGYNGMWVEYNQAATVNTEVNGGHYQNPNEQFIMTPTGNIHSAVVCGNTLKNVKFYGKITINNTTVVQNQVDLEPVLNGQATINTNVVALNTKVDALTAGQAQLGQNQQIILAGVQNNSNSLATVLTNQEEILANTAAAAKYSKQARNWSIASTVVSTLGATASAVDLFNGDGRRSVQYVSNTIDSFNTFNTPATTDGGSTGGPDLNGSN